MFIPGSFLCHFLEPYLRLYTVLFIVQYARHLLKFFIHAHCEHRHLYVYMYVRESYDNCVVRRIVAKC